MKLKKMRINVFFLLIWSMACNNNPAKETTVNTTTELMTESLESTPITGNADSLSITVAEFDKTKWIAKDDHHYIYRDEMLTLIMNNHMLDSLNEKEILDLLGEPDRIDNHHWFYTIAQKRLGFWPLHTKTLVIKLKQDGMIEWVRIHK